MRPFILAVAALCTLAAGASQAQQQLYFGPPTFPPTGIAHNVPYCGPYVGRAPDFSTPGYYLCNCYGQVSGPYQSVYPSFQPWNGAVFPPPQPQQPAGGGPAGGPGCGPACGPGLMTGVQAVFPHHPFARSPRDYFMEYEREQDGLRYPTIPR